jgi:AcrR family transcriptional regulator
MAEQRPTGPGRPRVSSRALIEQAAIRLFLTEGYEDVTVERIAAEAEVGRATFFRYFTSKSDLVFGAFDLTLDVLRDLLAAAPARAVASTVIANSVVESTRQALTNPAWLDRFVLLDTSPGLRAGAAGHWAAWAEIIAGYLTRRYQWDDDDVRAIGFAGAVLHVYVAVLRRPTNNQADPAAFVADLEQVLIPTGKALNPLLRLPAPVRPVAAPASGSRP